METTAYLQAHDVNDWAAIRAIISDTTCAWADIGGWHLGEPPNDQPIGSTHVWAWTGDGCFAIRLGGFRPRCAELRLRFGHFGDEVAVRQHASIIWGSDDQRVPASAVSTLPGRVEVLDVVGPMPLSFVRVMR